MRKLLARLILWATETNDASRNAIIQEHEKRLRAQEQAWTACASEIEGLRSRIAELSDPERQAPTVRRAGNWGQFRTAAEQASRKQ